MIHGFHDFTLDQGRHELRRAGQVVSVEPKTFQVLLYLLQHRDRAVTKDELLEQCWPGMFVSEAALTRCLAKIRQAVQPSSAGPLVIQTVHRLGYRFVATVIEQPDAVALAAVTMPPVLPAPEPLSLPVQGASEALEPDTSAAVPSIASRPSTGTPAADLTALVCPQCQATNRAARQFCAGCGHELWQPCPRCGFRNSPTEHFCGGCGQAMVAVVSVPTTARTGPPRAYTPAHLAARISPGQPGLVGERKLVTILAVSVQGLRALRQTYDLEEVDEVLNRGFAQLVAEVHRVEGFVAQVAGRHVTALFGAPVACEDQVLRALHAALGIQRAFARFATEVRRTHGVELGLRLGVHTGPVVVSGISPDLQLTYTASGATLEVASELQQWSQEEAIVVSEAVQQQAAGFFRCTALGVHTLPEMPEPMQVYTCEGVGSVTSRLERALGRGRTAFYGRAQELALLAAYWGRVCRGMGQVVCLVGEAGIGKSRLAYECQQTLGAARWLTVQALSYGQAMPYHAVLPLLRTVFGVVETADPAHQRQAIQTRLAALTPPLTEDAPLLAQLLGVPLAPEALPALSPEAQRRRLQFVCLQGLMQQAADSPLGLLVEDGHWLDPSSQELLDLLVASLARRAMVVLCTARPGFQPGWSAYAYFHQVAIEPLAVEETEALVRDLLQPHAASAGLRALIWERTRGNPFFVEELVRAMQAHGLLTVQDDVYEVIGNPRRMLPASIQGVVQARLDQLPPEDKRLVQVAAVIGPEVPLPLLQALAEPSEDGLHRSLTRLQAAAWLYEARTFPTPIYTFAHTLVQEVIYQSLLQPTRQHYHEQIVQVLTAQFPETAETQPELVAHHATAAGWSALAIASWQRAGEMALARSAHMEATTHFRRGLELLMTLPETPARAQTELALQRALSTSLLLTRGFAAPEVAQVYGRARVLCEQVGDPAQRFPVLFGLRGFYEVRGELQIAWELGEQLLAVAQHEPDAPCRLQAHRALGDTAFWLGEFGLARAHLEQAIALHDPQQHATATFRDGQDHGIASWAFLPRVLWVQGYPEQALSRSLEVLTLVHDRSHPFDLAVALNAAAMIHQLRRESAAVRARAEALLALSHQQHFALYGAMGTVQRGWALVVQGQRAEGSAQILAGLEAYRATGAMLIQPYFLALLAQAYVEAGQTAEGLRVLEEALTLVHKTGERFYEAELYRLQGDLVLAHTPRRHAEAHALYQQALALARRQQARSWELRAAISLSRLWQQQGKWAEAQQLLAEIYHWFTEGFDTADLQEAKALLDELL